MHYIARDACICGPYRYWLLRQLSHGSRTVLFVGVNPSTADARQDDPTVRRCVGFARTWGFDVLYMANLYAYRATDPRALSHVEDPVGPENASHLEALARRADTIVCAWGATPLLASSATSAAWLQALPHARHLGCNKDGTPKHPLYRRTDTPLQVFA